MATSRLPAVNSAAALNSAEGEEVYEDCRAVRREVRIRWDVVRHRWRVVVDIKEGLGGCGVQSWGWWREGGDCGWRG